MVAAYSSEYLVLTMKMCFDNHQIVLKMDNSKLRDVTVIKAPRTWGRLVSDQAMFNFAIRGRSTYADACDIGIRLKLPTTDPADYRIGPI